MRVIANTQLFGVYGVVTTGQEFDCPDDVAKELLRMDSVRKPTTNPIQLHLQKRPARYNARARMERNGMTKEQIAKIRAQQAQQLAAMGLPTLGPGVAEQLEQWRRKKLYWRWPTFKAKVSAAWDRLIAPWSEDRLYPLPKPSEIDQETRQLLVNVVQTMAGMHKLQQIESSHIQLLWGAVRTIAQSLEVNLDVPESSAAELSDGARRDITELQKLLNLPGPTDGSGKKKGTDGNV